MDFFEYASIAEYFVNTNNRWLIYLVGGLCFLIVFVFQAVALYTIAKKAGYKNKWMAFIPFFNTYYIGVCAQKNKLFNSINAKMLGIIAAAFEFVLVAANIVNNVAYSLVEPYQYFEEITTLFGTTGRVYYLGDVPANLNWAAWCYNYLDTVLGYVQLAFLLVKVGLLICFFQTYASRRYVLFAITSIILPISGILFFVVRNNKGLNYREYVQNEQARQYRMYQQYQQYYHQQQNYDKNPYDSNPYDRNPYENAQGGNPAQRQTPPDDPFGGLGEDSSKSNDSNPFDDFKS